MRNYIEQFTHQLEDALNIGRAISIKKSNRTIKKIWIAGMGGSGIGANMVQALTRSDLPLPLVVTKGYTAPGFTDNRTLLIACSYSGNTEETLSCLHAGLTKEAQIVCITSGGEMAGIANQKALSIVPLPAGSSSPRAMLGYSITALLHTLYHVGLINNTFIEETRRAIALLNQKETEIQKKATQVAHKLKDKLPWLYGAENVNPLLTRFQNQLNENSKHLAHVNTFPEMNHNEIEGWNFPKTILPLLQIIYLNISPSHERVKQRMKLCKALLEKSSHPVIDLFAEGNSMLEQYYFLIHLTDWISFFLAHENKVDPASIPSITQLKVALQSVS